MDKILSFWENLKNVTVSITPVDGLDILVLTVVIYAIIKWMRETRAEQLVKGIVLLTLAYVIASACGMKSISFLLSKTFDVGLIALLVMFQPELRRALEKVGHTKVAGLGVFQIGSDMSDETAAKWNTAIEAICDACEDLSATTTGALIVIERQTRLGEQIDTGTILNAQPSKELFGNIFYPKTPLHDGAVIMRDGMILAAACFLPKPQKEELINKQLGSRHRAAIGMSENSDAIVVVVSEETGCISVAENGVLNRPFTRDSLKKLLRTKLLPEKPQNHSKKKLNFRRLFK